MALPGGALEHGVLLRAPIANSPPNQFDYRFMSQVVADHQGVIDAATAAQRLARDPELKSLIGDVLALQSDHLVSAQEMLAEIPAPKPALNPVPLPAFPTGVSRTNDGGGPAAARGVEAGRAEPVAGPAAARSAAGAREKSELTRHAYACICICMPMQSEARADLFASLADPMRRRIVELLRGHEKPVNDIVAELDIHQSGVSRHLRILNDAGFVSVRADGPRRLYALRAEPFRELDAWISRYRDLWEARLDRLAAELERRNAGKKAGATGATGATRGRNKEKGT